MTQKFSAGPGKRASLTPWLVHLFTASGVVIAMLALNAVLEEEWRQALLWLGVGLVVDGVDGTLARAARVRERLGRIDGDVLDLVIDFLTYVFVPAVFMWRGGLFPAGWELPLSALILISSLYVFARRDMKTDDGYFRGFPALWNVVAFYLYTMSWSAAVNAGIVAALAVLTFAPVHFVHPFRAERFRLSALAAAAGWTLSSAALLVVEDGPAAGGALRGISILSAAVLLAIGAFRTFRGPP